MIVEQGQQITQGNPFEVSTGVRVSSAPTDRSYMLKDESTWTWSDLRDYIIAKSTELFGTQLRDPMKESVILRAFIGRHGIEKAVLVAMAAYEVYGGIWMGAPVTVTRFTKNSDPYFADVILARVG